MRVRIHQVITFFKTSEVDVEPEYYEGAETTNAIALKEKEYIEHSPGYFIEGLDAGTMEISAIVTVESIDKETE